MFLQIAVCLGELFCKEIYASAVTIAIAVKLHCHFNTDIFDTCYVPAVIPAWFIYVSPLRSWGSGTYRPAIFAL